LHFYPSISLKIRLQPSNMSKFIYGIDFGTTNSALAVFDIQTSEVVKIFTTPSLLFFPEFQISRKNFVYAVGHKAVTSYVENRMKGRFMKSIKRILPNRSFKSTRIANKAFKVEDLVALIISHLKKQADEYVDEDIKSAVIGRPVVFDENPEKDALAQERLSRAVKICGFEHFFFQMEPIGAAFTYERQLEKDELVLVADLGGGTSDFTLMRLSPDAVKKPNRQEDMISKGGVYVGGDNFDSSIMWHRGTPHFGRGVKEKIADKWLDLPVSYFTNICSWEKLNFFNSIRMTNAISQSYFSSGNHPLVKNLMTLVDKNLGYTLFQEIEKTKIHLTDNDVANFEFDQHDIYFHESISIDEFARDIVHSDVEKIDQYLQQYLNTNQVNYDDIDTVFMTGGSSLVRPVQDIIHQKFGAEKVKSGDNFNSVAMGLAYSFGLFIES